MRERLKQVSHGKTAREACDLHSAPVHRRTGPLVKKLVRYMWVSGFKYRIFLGVGFLRYGPVSSWQLRGIQTCSLLPPQKNKKSSKRNLPNFFNKEIPDKKNIKKNEKKDDAKTKHPQIITYKKTKKSLCWKFKPAHFLNKLFKPS